MKTHAVRLLATIVPLIAAISARRLIAQEHGMVFSPTDPGVTRSMTNWGLDTCWASSDNMQRGLLYMGTNSVNIVRVGFFVDAPLTNNDVTPSDKSSMQTCINLAGMATAATKWDLNLNSSVNAWYNSGANLVYPDRWAAAMEACQRYYNRSFWAAEGFNEPDYTANNEGSAQNLYDIFGYLQASTNFPGTLMEGGSTLNDDVSVSWFNPIASRAKLGSTHCLAGTAANYVNLIQTVAASNSIPFNPELHNVMEAVLGVNYGLEGGIWWGTAELARGSFVNACQGKRLAYADDLNNWTAAAVYRGNNGAVQAFVGASERMATTTTYRFYSKDRAVFFDGNGPQRDYAVTIPGGTGYQQNQPNAERVVNITWGADVQPAIGGRYLVVNRNSGLVLEVPGGSTANGTFLDQNAFGNALYQEWDIHQVPSTFGGDYSYFTLTAAHDGVTADNINWSYASGNQIDQWNGGTNALEQWYFQYAGNGYFKIHNKWSTKILDIQNSSTSGGAAVVQSDDTGALSQQWRLIPAGVTTYDFVAPAAPTGVAATANAVSVKLNWTANTETDLAGYNVLRSTTSGGPYDLVARGLTTNSFTDGSANQAQAYYYVVAATDKSVNQSAYSSEVSATPIGGQAMLASYAFESNSIDGSGNRNDFELAGAPGYNTGKYGAALALNGAGQFAIVPAGIMTGVTNFTMAAWIYCNGGSQWQRVFDFGNDTTSYMFLTPNSGSGTLRFAITMNGGGGEQVLNSAAAPTNQWFHVAVTLNGTTASLYTNGVLATSGTVTVSPAMFNPAANLLGKSQYPADPTFNGRLDSVYIFNYALSAADIVNLANGTPPNNGPAAPTALRATGGTGVVNLTWTQSTSPGITGNNIYRSTTGSSGPYSLLASLGATTSYSDTAVSAGGTYYYSVTAVNGSGESSLSAYGGATTTPAAPAGVTALAGYSQATLAWSASTGANSYNVKRATTIGGPYTTLATGVTSTRYTDNSASNGTTYYYVVSAVNSSGESANSSQASAAPPGNVFAYLKFDETRGTTASDATGHGWNGTLINGPTWVAGYSNNAVNLSGSSQYVSLPTGVASTLTNFTISTWVNLTSVSTWNRIFDFGSGGVGATTGAYMFLTPQSGSGVVRFSITSSGYNNEQQINGTAAIAAGAWHHVAVTLSGNVGTLYVDRVPVGTNSNMTLKPWNLGNSTQNWIGRSQFSDPYLNGKVDEFRIYNAALTAAQIAALP